MEHNNCICSDSNYCTNSFDEFIKCKNYNLFQNFHPIIKLVDDQNYHQSEIKLNFQGNILNLQENKTNLNKDVIIKLIRLFLEVCNKIEISKKKIICMVIFEIIFNNLQFVKSNKNFQNTVRKKIHTFIKESFNEFEELSKYNNNINPILTIKRLFDLHFPEK